MTSGLITKFKQDVNKQYEDYLKKVIKDYPEYHSWKTELDRYQRNPNFIVAYDALDGDIDGYQTVLSDGGENTSYLRNVHRVGDSYIVVEGSYSSWEGSEWDEDSIMEVFPKEVTVVKYEP